MEIEKCFKKLEALYRSIFRICFKFHCMIPLYIRIWKNNLRRRMCDILNLEGMQWSISFWFCISSDKKVVLLPEFLCSSISDAILRAGWKFQYYTVSKDLEIVEEEIEEKIQEYPVLFFIDYFGKNQSQKFLKRLKESYSELVLIEDCTQSIMTKRTEESIADYMLASLRKWFPIPSGGCVWSNHSLPSVQ